MFSHSSGSQTSKIKILAGPSSFWSLWRRSLPGYFLASGNSHQFLMVLGLWQHYSSLCLCLHKVFHLHLYIIFLLPMSVIVPEFPLFIRIPSIGWGTTSMTLSWLLLHKYYFHTKSHSEILGGLQHIGRAGGYII